MKKYYLIILLLHIATIISSAQNLWERIPLEFNDIYLANTSGPWVMYYDSIADVSYIAGTFQKIGDSSCNVVQLDENGYTLLPPSPLPYTYDITRYNGEIYFSGPGLATWDGQKWTLLDSTTISVGDLIIHNDSLWSSVNFPTDSVWVSGVGRWTGSSWENMYRADTLTSGGWGIHALAFYKDELYIGGNLNNINYPEIQEIARFDGTRWRDVGGFQSGDLDDVRELLVWKDTLYVGGAFRETHGSPGNGIAKWDGENWHRLSNGVLQSSIPAVIDMAVFDNELFITGWFYWVDGIQYPNVSFIDFAKWDGTKWCTMGTRADNLIHTIGRYRDSLFVMGGFHLLNGQPMGNMAKWIGGDYTDSCAIPTADTGTGINHPALLAPESLSLYPNPAKDILNIRFQHNAPYAEKAVLQIIDITGRILQTKPIPLSSGENRMQMNIGKLVPGMYFLKVSDSRNNRIQKFIKQQ